MRTQKKIEKQVFFPNIRAMAIETCFPCFPNMFFSQHVFNPLILLRSFFLPRFQLHIGHGDTFPTHPGTVLSKSRRRLQRLERQRRSERPRSLRGQGVDHALLLRKSGGVSEVGESDDDDDDDDSFEVI